MLPLGGWHKLDNTLIIKFTMKTVFCSAGRDEIKPCFGFSLFELLVHGLFSHCMDVGFFKMSALLSNCLKCDFFVKF